MKNRKLCSLISLLLVLVMTLTMIASCGGTGDSDPDAPVTAEAIFSNFVTVDKADDGVLDSIKDITEEYGRLEDSYGECIIFEKNDKDRFNNLTQTYTLYSVAEMKAVATITNKYADEFGGDDDYGHKTYPEKLITDAEIQSYRGLPVFAIEYTLYTRIDDEIIEDNELDYSYSEKTYVEFYDVSGKLITTSYVTDEGEYIDSNDYYIAVSFGKTVAIFDKDCVMVDSYDGDVNADVVLYDHMNDKYNYMLNVPIGVTDGSLAMTRTAIEVYNKEGELVCYYPYGDLHTMHMANVLESGDILIQQINTTEWIEGDISMGEDMNIVFETYVLDVETGVVESYPDFPYLVEAVQYAEDLDKNSEGLKATENVRNIASAAKLVDGETKDCMVFFDNFMNVNFEFDGKLCYEMEELELWVMDNDHILVRLNSGVANRAMLDGKGNLIAYVPDNALVLSDYIVVDNKVYDLNMKDIDLNLSTYWQSSYENVELAATVGNTIIYSCTDIEKDADTGTERTQYDIVVVYINSRYYGDSIQYYRNTTVYAEQDEDADYENEPAEIDSYIVLKGEDGLITVVNGLGNRIISLTADNCQTVETEDAVVFTFDTDKGKESFLVTESEMTEGGEYDEKE